MKDDVLVKSINCMQENSSDTQHSYKFVPSSLSRF